MNARTQRATEAAPRRARPGVEVVEPPSGRRWGITTIVAALLATLLLFGLVGFQALIVGTQSTLDDLDARIASAERENQRLRLDVAQREAPDRIRDYAIAYLGMIEPETVLYLEPLTAAELGESEGDG